MFPGETQSTQAARSDRAESAHAGPSQVFLTLGVRWFFRLPVLHLSGPEKRAFQPPPPPPPCSLQTSPGSKQLRLTWRPWATGRPPREDLQGHRPALYITLKGLTLRSDPTRAAHPASHRTSMWPHDHRLLVCSSPLFSRRPLPPSPPPTLHPPPATFSGPLHWPSCWGTPSTERPGQPASFTRPCRPHLSALCQAQTCTAVFASVTITVPDQYLSSFFCFPLF